MKVELLVRGISELVTAEGWPTKRGAQMRELRVVKQAAMAIDAGMIVWVGPEAEWNGSAAKTVELGGCAVVPGLVDPHTHAVWAGNRLQDFEARAAGVSYETILAAGGGIRSTIRDTAAATVEELVRLAVPRVEALMRSGAVVIEIKSGYGFEPAAELRMLEAIDELSRRVGAKIVATLLIHVPPVEGGERREYERAVREELVPEVGRRGLASCVDVFVEKEAWSAEEAGRLLAAGRMAGLKGKVHADQFHAVGGVEMAIAAGALSVDHLEASGEAQIRSLAASETVGVMLPGVSLHLGIAAARGRALIDAGAAVAVGTDLNPGSSPLFSMAEAMALSVRMNGLLPAEALVAGTVNSACALGLKESGRLEAGCRADFVVVDGRDWREVVYALGGRAAKQVWIGGRVLDECD